MEKKFSAGVIALVTVIVQNCDAIKAAIGTAAQWFYDMASFFSGLWNSITAFASAAWAAIKNTFQAVGAWFYENLVQPVAGFFSGLWDGFKAAAANAWEGVKSVFSATGNIFVNTKEYHALWSSKAAAL